jgi:hypothetical protein
MLYPESSEAWVPISAIGPRARRLAPDEKRARAPFLDRRNAAAQRSGSSLTRVSDLSGSA